MAHDVICDVHNCNFNNQKRCHAKAIKVCTGNAAKAEHVRETQCDTFECK